MRALTDESGMLDVVEAPSVDISTSGKKKNQRNPCDMTLSGIWRASGGLWRGVGEAEKNNRLTLAEDACGTLKTRRSLGSGWSDAIVETAETGRALFGLAMPIRLANLVVRARPIELTRPVVF